jgi:hypothetical protein
MYRDIGVRVLGLDAYDPSYDDEIAAAGLSLNAEMSGEWNQVAALMRDEVIASLPDQNNLVAFMWQEPEVAGTTIAAYDLDETDRLSGEMTLEDDTWLVFIDMQPGAMWEHETMFVYVDADTLVYDIEYHQGYPVIDDYGMWNTDDMRQKTDYWIHPIEKNVNQENIFEKMGGDEEEDGDIEYIIDYGIDFKIEYDYDIVQTEEERQKGRFCGRRQFCMGMITHVPGFGQTGTRHHLPFRSSWKKQRKFPRR